MIRFERSFSNPLTTFYNNGGFDSNLNLIFILIVKQQIYFKFIFSNEMIISKHELRLIIIVKFLIYTPPPKHQYIVYNLTVHKTNF